MLDKVFSNYKIISELGKGSFGIVYKAENLLTKQIVALKLEQIQFENSQLENAFQVYNALRGTKGIPEIFYFGKYENYYFLVISILGPSLSDIHALRKNISLKSVVLIGKRVIDILERIHDKGWIYRDMKPENILIRGNEIYLVDFGMCKKYLRNGVHIPMITNKVLTGTARYASVNTHKGVEQSRRDDLEGLFYVLIFLLKGELPWMGVPAPTRKEKYSKIGEIKEQTDSKTLCKDLIGEKYWIEFIKKVKSLRFDEKPDYAGLKSILNNILKKAGVKDDGVFDWHNRNEKEEKKKGTWSNIVDFFNKL